jgi:chemotaxis protein MotB
MSTDPRSLSMHLRSLRRAPLLALVALVGLSVLSASCAAQRPARLPQLSADAPATLVEPHAAVDAAYQQCAESYNSARIPWQAPTAIATGGLALLGLVAMGASPLIANVVVPIQWAGYTAAASVVVFGVVTGVSAAATAWLIAQVPPLLERTKVQGRLLQIVEGRALEATAAEDVDTLDALSREIYEDCRVAQASADARSAEIVIRDLQRYRREAEDAKSRATTSTAARDELAALNTTLEGKLADANAAIKRADARHEAVAGRIAALEENISEKQAENASLKGEVDRLEGEQALLSEEKRKLLNEKKKLEEKTNYYEEVASALENQLKDGKIALRRLQNGVVLELPNAVLFPSGKAELNEAGLETLNAVAEAIKNLKDRRIRIEGHTDSVPVGKKSEFASNWELSSARALAVTRYLQDLGVDPSRMSAEARSQYAPAVSNKSRTGRARNRRIEIYLVPLPAGAAAKFKTEE